MPADELRASKSAKQLANIVEGNEDSDHDYTSPLLSSQSLSSKSKSKKSLRTMGEHRVGDTSPARGLGLTSGPSTKEQPSLIVLSNVATPKPTLHRRLDSGKKSIKMSF